MNGFIPARNVHPLDVAQTELVPVSLPLAPPPPTASPSTHTFSMSSQHRVWGASVPNEEVMKELHLREKGDR